MMNVPFSCFLCFRHTETVFSLNPQLVSCGVSSYQHSSVSLEFFETVVRYDKFFIVEPQHIPNVLVSDFVFSRL